MMSTVSPDAAVKTDRDVHIAELERELRNLRAELAEMRRQTAQRSDAIPRALQQLVDMTHELFPGDVRIESGTDPDYADTPSIVFRVTPTEKPRAVNSLVDKEVEWHRAAREIIANATCYFSLTVD